MDALLHLGAACGCSLPEVGVDSCHFPRHAARSGLKSSLGVMTMTIIQQNE